jgi:hypothetical protein
MVNVIMIHSKEAYFLASVEVISNTGDNYYAVLKAEKEKLETRGVAVIGVVGDNASGVQNALRRFVYFLSIAETPTVYVNSELKLRTQPV